MARANRINSLLFLTFLVLVGGSARAAGRLVTTDLPQAPDSASWNSLTVALDTGGVLARASELLAAIPGAVSVMRWAAVNQTFERYLPGEDHQDFALRTGDPVFIAVDERAGSTFTLTGDVPPPGAVTLEMAGGSPCQWNHLSLPLELGAVTNAQQLAEAIRGTDDGAVEQVLRWDGAIQNFIYWVPAPVGGADGLGTNFPTAIGSDTFVCLSREITWP